MRYIKLHDETATSADVHAELVAAFHFTVSHSRVQKMARVAYVGLEAERAKLARHGGAKGKRRAPTPPETAHPPTASRSEGSADPLFGISRDDEAGLPGSRDTSDSGRDTIDSSLLNEHGEAPPCCPLVAHVARAFLNFEKTVGATKAEIAKASRNAMDARTHVSLKAMHVEPTPKNFVLGSKAYKLMIKDAQTKGAVLDDMVYWKMAHMYAADPVALRSFAMPTAEDMGKVRALILNEYAPRPPPP